MSGLNKIQRFGVITPDRLLVGRVKEALFLFDSLVVDMDIVDQLISFYRTNNDDAALEGFLRQRADILEGRRDELAAHRTIVDISSLLRDKAMLRKTQRLLVEELGNKILGVSDTTTLPADEQHNIVHEACRQMTVNTKKYYSELLAKEGHCAAPMYDGQGEFDAEFSGGSTVCLTVVLHSLPVLQDTVSMRELLAFRDDPQTQRRRTALWTWVHNTSRKNFSAAETADCLANLLDEYTEHVRISKLRYELGVVEMVMTVGAEVLDGLLHLNPTKAVKSLFAFKKRHLDLEEAMLKGPGREVALIHHVRDKFT